MRKRAVQTPAQDDPILMRPSRACHELGIVDNTLRRLVKDGLIEVRYITVPGSKASERRIVTASLRAYVESLPQDRPKPGRAA